MNIFRLSLFNLKKNRKEAAAIAFLTMVTTLMLAMFMMNRTKINSGFDDSFAASGCPDHCIAVREDKYHDEYREILENTPGVRDVIEEELIESFGKDVEKDGEMLSFSLKFVTEKTEKKIEDFVKRDRLSEEETARLTNPIWLPVYFEITTGYKPGDTFTVITDGIRCSFQIAGFYENGLMDTDGYGFKCIVSESDYAMLGLMLNDGIEGRYTGLWFNSDEDFSINDFIRRCSDASSESIDTGFWGYSRELEKTATLQYLNMLLYFIAFFSAVTMLSALFVITHRISEDIEDQMQQIGVLEALGYRSWAISLSYVGEYLICGGVGSVLGGIAAFLTAPVLDTGVQKMMGRTVSGSSGIFELLLAVILAAAIVIVTALIKAARVKRYPPVTALRKGIAAHHFGRDILPLEKSKGNINLLLAAKSFVGDIRSSLGVALCVTISGIAILLCANFYGFFRNGIEGLLDLCGTDFTVNVGLMNGVDPDAVRDEIMKMPGVRKVLFSYGGLINYISVKGSDNRAWAQCYDDFGDSENIHLISGRFPKHDNEVMITVARNRAEGLDIGDSLILEGRGVESKYIITGITSSLINNGMGIYLTTEGYKRTNLNARPTTLSVYLDDGTDQDTFEQRLYEIYGKTVKDCLNAEYTGGSLEDRIRAEADAKMAVLVSYYGVSNADYAVAAGGQVIKGNSRGFVIKEVSSFMTLADQQMSGIANAAKTVSVIAMAVIAVVVAVIIGLIVSSTIKRQRKELGIMKGMGYSSNDLMKQITLKTMPVTIVSVIIAAVLTRYVYGAFWVMSFGAVGSISLPMTVGTSAGIIVLCYAVTCISAGRIKAISVTELMTE